MIVAEQKGIDEIAESLEGFTSVVVAACGTCVTVCMAGGEKEALTTKGVLEAKAKESGAPRAVTVVNCKRQCDNEFIDDLDAGCRKVPDRVWHGFAVCGGY